MEELNFSLPFCGKAGMISRILTIDGAYLKYEYDSNGNEKKEPFIVPKRNKKDLIKNYVEDVSRYLKYNEDKLNTYRSNRLKKVASKGKVDFDLGLSTVLTLVSVVLCVMTYQVTSSGFHFYTVFSTLTAGVSSCFFIKVLKDKVDYQSDLKKAKFISEYNGYMQILNNYNIKKAKELEKSPTKYQGLVDERSNANTLRKNKVLIER